MNKRIRFVLVSTAKIFLTIIITVLVLEFALRLVDPWGVVRYQKDGAELRGLYTQHPNPGRTYALPDSQIHLSNWMATIREGNRIIVDNTPKELASCTIAILGDSVPFGLGVNDEDIFANLIARTLPGVHFINTAYSGYNFNDIYAAFETTEADGYLYLLNSNDDDDPYTAYLDENRRPESIAIAYFIFVLKRVQSSGGSGSGDVGATLPTYPEWVTARLEQLDRPDVSILGFDNPLMHYALNVVSNAYQITEYTEPISTADGHPNVEGHMQLAEEMRPYVRDLIASVCPETPISP